MIIYGKEYKFKFTLRAMMLFEQITEKVFNISTITDEYLYFYCVLMVNNPDSDLTFEKLIDWIDDNPSTMTEFKNALEAYSLKLIKLEADSKKK